MLTPTRKFYIKYNSVRVYEQHIMPHPVIHIRIKKPGLKSVVMYLLKATLRAKYPLNNNPRASVANNVISSNKRIIK